jgi:hypothetical protein
MQALEKHIIGKPAQWLINAAESIGLEISSLSHEVTNYFMNHSIKRHGNVKIEKAQGQVAITLADFDRILDIVNNPDITVLNIKHNQEILIAYAKRFEDSTIIYFEEILNSRKNKTLRSKTMFKKRNAIDKNIFLNIVSANTHIDVSTIKIMVGVGDHPDKEAEA